MKLAVGSDEKTVPTDFVVEELKRRGHTVLLSGPPRGEAMGWPDVGEKNRNGSGQRKSGPGGSLLLDWNWSYNCR